MVVADRSTSSSTTTAPHKECQACTRGLRKLRLYIMGPTCNAWQGSCTQHFLESDESLGMGMENHTGMPAVFAAETFDHAKGYAWPSTMLHDNIYYGVVLQLQVLSSGIRSRSTRGEVCFSNQAVRIAAVYLLLNLDIGQGESKMPEWRDELELLPDALLARRAASCASTGELSHCPSRETAWWTNG